MDQETQELENKYFSRPQDIGALLRLTNHHLRLGGNNVKRAKQLISLANMLEPNNTTIRNLFAQYELSVEISPDEKFAPEESTPDGYTGRNVHTIMTLNSNALRISEGFIFPTGRFYQIQLPSGAEVYRVFTDLWKQHPEGQ
jgi:hypothetical protein